MVFYSEVFSTLSSFNGKSESIPMSIKSLYAFLKGSRKLPATAVIQDTVVDLREELHGWTP